MVPISHAPFCIRGIEIGILSLDFRTNGVIQNPIADAKFDQFVYAFYGLTDKESKFVEEVAK